MNIRDVSVFGGVRVAESARLLANATGSTSVKRLRRNPVPLLGVLAFVALATFGASHATEANVADVSAAFQSPSRHHLFGTDQLGRDMLLRTAVGARISFIAALTASGVGAMGGLIIALLCGLGPRWLDRLLMTITDAFLAFPQLILALALSVALGVGLVSATIGIAVTMVPIFARTLRVETISVASRPFVQAGRTIGLSRPHIAVRHIVPHVSTTLAIQFGANFGVAILTLAGLSFVGVGAQPPMSEWGSMISDGMAYTLSGQWWISTIPGIALVALVLAVNTLIDQLRRAG